VVMKHANKGCEEAPLLGGAVGRCDQKIGQGCNTTTADSGQQGSQGSLRNLGLGKEITPME